MKNNICECKETRYNKCDEKFYHLKGKVEMYLISIYFDEVTEKRIRSYMRQIGKATGNVLMLDGNVPPHITIAGFHAESENTAREIFLRRKELSLFIGYLIVLWGYILQQNNLQRRWLLCKIILCF